MSTAHFISGPKLDSTLEQLVNVQEENLEFQRETDKIIDEPEEKTENEFHEEENDAQLPNSKPRKFPWAAERQCLLDRTLRLC